MASENSRKSPREKKNPGQREKWLKEKRQGRPKQVWVPAMLDGKTLEHLTTLAQVEAAITEETIGSYVSAHWEKA